jgi:hypothetical protein
LREFRSTARELRELFDQRLTVRHIAEKLKYANAEEDGEVVRRRMVDPQIDFDIMPVLTDGRVHGYVVRDELRGGPCGEQMRPLEPELLIAESTPLLDAFALLREHRWRFVLERNNVAAIVTRGDLRKAPTRMFLFILLNLLEMHLGRLIRHYWPEEAWRSLLNSTRLENAEKLQADRKARNEALDLVDCLQLCDKRDVALAMPTIITTLGFDSKGKAEAFLRHAEALRNRIAHAHKRLEGASWPELFSLAADLEKAVRCSEEASAETLPP